MVEPKPSNLFSQVLKSLKSNVHPREVLLLIETAQKTRQHSQLNLIYPIDCCDESIPISHKLGTSPEFFFHLASLESFPSPMTLIGHPGFIPGLIDMTFLLGLSHAFHFLHPQGWLSTNSLFTSLAEPSLDYLSAFQSSQFLHSLPKPIIFCRELHAFEEICLARAQFIYHSPPLTNPSSKCMHRNISPLFSYVKGTYSFLHTM